jgi:hypothetical protein
VSAVKWSLWEIGAASGKEKEQQSKQQRVARWLVVGHAFLRKELWISLTLFKDRRIRLKSQ